MSTAACPGRLNKIDDVAVALSEDNTHCSTLNNLNTTLWIYFRQTMRNPKTDNDVN